MYAITTIKEAPISFGGWSAQFLPATGFTESCQTFWFLKRRYSLLPKNLYLIRFRTFCKAIRAIIRAKLRKSAVFCCQIPWSYSGNLYRFAPVSWYTFMPHVHLLLMCQLPDYQKCIEQFKRIFSSKSTDWVVEIVIVKNDEVIDSFKRNWKKELPPTQGNWIPARDDCSF